MKICLVEWVDSVALGERWIDNDDINDLEVCQCVSIGIELINSEDKIVLSQSHGTGKNNSNNLIAIPRGCIKRIRYLKIEEAP